MSWQIKSESSRETIKVELDKNGKEVGNAIITYKDSGLEKAVSYIPTATQQKRQKRAKLVLKFKPALWLLLGALIEFLVKK